jgi:hypothetical protein
MGTSGFASLALVVLIIRIVDQVKAGQASPTYCDSSRARYNLRKMPTAGISRSALRD